MNEEGRTERKRREGLGIEEKIDQMRRERNDRSEEEERREEKRNG